jgi:hypothetical protein
MRVNKQMHNEVRKYFYERVTLSLSSVFQLENTSLYEDNTMALRETMAAMSPDILPLFKQLSVHINGYSTASSLRTQPTPHPLILKHMFNMLTGLERLVITFGTAPRSNMWAGQDQKSIQQKYMDEMKMLLIDLIPPSVKVSWSHEDAARFFNSDVVEQQLWKAIQERTSTDTNERVGISV